MFYRFIKLEINRLCIHLYTNNVHRFMTLEYLYLKSYLVEKLPLWTLIYFLCTLVHELVQISISKIFHQRIIDYMQWNIHQINVVWTLCCIMYETTSFPIMEHLLCCSYWIICHCDFLNVWLVFSLYVK